MIIAGCASITFELEFLFWHYVLRSVMLNVILLLVYCNLE